MLKSSWIIKTVFVQGNILKINRNTSISVRRQDEVIVWEISPKYPEKCNLGSTKFISVSQMSNMKFNVIITKLKTNDHKINYVRK